MKPLLWLVCLPGCATAVAPAGACSIFCGEALALGAATVAPVDDDPAGDPPSFPAGRFEFDPTFPDEALLVLDDGRVLILRRPTGVAP